MLTVLHIPGYRYIRDLLLSKRTYNTGSNRLSCLVATLEGLTSMYSNARAYPFYYDLNLLTLTIIIIKFITYKEKKYTGN